jgi:hypothetical protein
MTIGGTVILEGIVGSHAYGLEREDSDSDFQGVFVAPTLEVAGLHWRAGRESVHKATENEDFTYHEVGKFLRLALKCNPTVLELLWLDHYTTITIHGRKLLSLREAFLSRDAVRNSYLGYARSQNLKLRAKADVGHPRQAKMGRHMLRLLRQGRLLAQTGQMHLKVGDPQEYFDFDDMSVRDMLEIYSREIMQTHEAFEKGNAALPDKPDLEEVELALDGFRRTFTRRGVG